MAGYTRQSTADILPGEDLTAEPVYQEFNQLAQAFGINGHTHDGTQGNAPPIPLATSVSGYLPAINGGIGGRNNNTAVTAPTVTDDASKGYVPLSTWTNTATNQAYICVSNQPGAAVWNLIQAPTGTFLQPGNNLSDITSSSQARTNLGLVIGTNVQAYSAKLTDLNAFSTEGSIPYYNTTTNTFTAFNSTAFSRSLMANTAASGWRTGLGITDPAAIKPTVVNAPVNGSTASLNGGNLVLSVAQFLPLYPLLQKSIRFQVATDMAFTNIIYDSGNVATTSLSVSVPNAQSTFTGGTTYYVRAQQIDQEDYTSAWTPTTSFVFPRLPVAPTMSAPANNATNVGQNNSPVTLTASSYSHPNSTPQQARRFELSKDNFATIVTVAGTVGQNSATIASPKDVLTQNTLWKIRAVDTDTNGGVSTGTATQFTTVAAYLANPGEASDGGFMGFQNFGDGTLNHLILASKSTEASKVWQSSTSLVGAYSRLNGPGNTALLPAGATSLAAPYAASISIGGTAGYLWAIDEARAISSKLRPSAATVAAFQAGGSEVFVSGGYWSSSEIDASTARGVVMTSGDETNSGTGNGKTASFPVRAIKRVPASMPYPIGTYDASWGGYLAAYFTDLSSGSPQLFMLIVADKATEVTRATADGSAGSANTSPNKQSRTNGARNTAYTNTDVTNTGAGSNFPAAYYCDQLVSGGKDDWYLGAIDEMLAIARMNASLPSAQQLNQTDGMWTSTEVDASTAKALATALTETAYGKATSHAVRPIRRVALTL